MIKETEYCNLRKIDHRVFCDDCNIELTSYEKEQEQSAIISYQELLKNKDNQQTINIDKVSIDPEDMPLPSFKVNLMNYEKEEAFLKALKQLQSDLAR